MTLREANPIYEGFRFRYPGFSGVWQVAEITGRGAVVNGTDPSNNAHKHLCEWHQRIEPIRVTKEPKR